MQTKVCIEDLKLTKDEHRFDRSDPVLVFDFVTSMVEECDTLSMSEYEAFLLLHKCLTWTASGNYRTALNLSLYSTGSNTSWPESIQYCRRTYATLAKIRDVGVATFVTKQKIRETGLALGTRLNLATYHSFNVHADVPKMNIFIDGIHSTTRTIVARFRKSQPRNALT